MGKYRMRAPEGEAGSSMPAIIIGCFVAFGGILYGYDTGTIGGILAMPYWLQLFSTEPPHILPDGTQQYYITSSQSSLIVSILSAGTFFGALGAAPLGDMLGRRLGLIVGSLVFMFGVIIQTAATAIPMFVAGRFFAGLGVGFISALVPMYQSETAPKWIRGSIVGLYQFAITIGLFLASIVDNGTKGRNDTGSYRIPVAIQFAWALILIVGMLILPETPRFNIKMGRHDKALKSLSRLRRLPQDHPALHDELSEIQANHDYESSLGKARYIDCFRGNLGKRLATGCLLQGLQQLTGVNFIFYYGTSFFTNSGISNAFIISVITNVVNVISTIPGLYFVERWGRRPLLFWGAVGMFVCQYIVAITGTVQPGSLVANKVLIAFVCVYIFFFASTWGPIAWIVTGEIFPLKARAKCLSMTTATNWLLNWAIAYATPFMVNEGPGNANLGSKVFFIWGTFCLLCAFFVYALIYETKGFTLEEVDEMYAKVPHAWKSKGFVPSVRFRDVQDLAHEGGGGAVGGRSQSLAEMESAYTRRKSQVQAGDLPHADGRSSGSNEKEKDYHVALEKYE
ncbi:Plasma membrane low glucose sensor [Agyrium rufum]|nr:Plasma membrane low glucose sensor [Agyrium rufum]